MPAHVCSLLLSHSEVQEAKMRIFGPFIYIYQPAFSGKTAHSFKFYFVAIV